MSTEIYFLNKDYSRKLKISWDGFFFDIFKRNFVIHLDNQTIDTIQHQTELEKGKTYALQDNSTLQICLDPNKLKVLHNENILEAYQDPRDSVKATLSMSFLLGWLRIVLGIIALLPFTREGVSQSYKIWYGYFPLIFGFALILLGYVARKNTSTIVLVSIGLLALLQMIMLDMYGELLIDGHFRLIGIVYTFGLIGQIFTSYKNLQKIQDLEKSLS